MLLLASCLVRKAVEESEPEESSVPTLDFVLVYNVALPVCNVLLPFLHLQKPMVPTMALTNHSSILMRSIQTAFFILWIPPLMYIDPKRPKTATQSMNRTTSQAKRIAVVKELRMIGRMA